MISSELERLTASFPNPQLYELALFCLKQKFYTYQSYQAPARFGQGEPLKLAHNVSKFYLETDFLFQNSRISPTVIVTAQKLLQEILYDIKIEKLKQHLKDRVQFSILLKFCSKRLESQNHCSLLTIDFEIELMTHVVTESCIKCKYTDCVDVCPVDCFRKGPNFLVIDPDECIDCAVCIPECPVDAIYAEEDVPDNQQDFIELNAELAKDWPSITRLEEACSDADNWKDVKEKKHLIEK